MKVQEFIENINNGNFNMEAALDIKKYLSIQRKQLIAQYIIDECTENVDGVIRLSSVSQYLSYVRYMINEHTNLEYIDADYDALCSTEYGGTSLLDAILFCFAEDAKECSRILNLMLDDYMRENTIESSIGRFLNHLSNKIDSLAESLENISLNDIFPEDVDTGKLNTFLNEYVK